MSETSRREILKAVGICPCCGKPKCSDDDRRSAARDRNRLKVKLELMQQNWPAPAIVLMTHKSEPSSSASCRRLEKLAIWIEGQEKSRTRRPSTKKSRCVVAEKLPEDYEISQFAELLAAISY